MWRLAFIAALASGCIRANGAFHCTTNADCSGPMGNGTCEAVGFCAFADPSCPSGSRFGSLSGMYAGQCAGPSDGGVADGKYDALPDAPDGPPGSPGFLAEAHIYGTTVDSISYPLTIPTGAMKRYLIVAVMIPSDCTVGSTSQTVTSVTYNGVALTQLKSILGTNCGLPTTRSEQWGLVAPAEGMHTITVQLSGPAQYTLHSGAMAFDNVNQGTPVRATAALSGGGTVASLDIASVAGDLVVNTVGHGGGISSTSQTLRWLQNVDKMYSLNNTAGATQYASGVLTTMDWTFVDNDEWQTISTTLRP